MILNNDFRLAVNILEGLTSNNPTSVGPIQFGIEYQPQHTIVTALHILNKAVLYGTKPQKTELLSLRHKIISLNSLLRSPSFNAVVQQKIGLDVSGQAANIEGIQIVLPQTKFEKMIEVLTKIPRIVLSMSLDILLLPGALVLLLLAKCKYDFNPKPQDIIKDKTPILLLHGSDFNESEWVVGRQFLKKKQYGSVFSLNYDGLASNDPKKGIDDYAKNKISAEVKRIKALTGSDRVILIGHSMGGMIAGYYAENLANADGVKVEHVISISSPWQGAPIIDCFWKFSCFSKDKEAKRYLQMSALGGTKTEPNFRRELVAKALKSERKGVRKYYNIFSSTDFAVPGARGSLTQDPRRQHSFNFLGHYSIVVWPSVWIKTRSWLNKIYASEQNAISRENVSAQIPASGQPILI